jgi:ferredoxin
MGKKIAQPKYEVVGQLEKFDEADNVQARAALEPDSALWQRYYKRHPELESQGRSLVKLRKAESPNPAQDDHMFGATFGTIGLMARDEDLDGRPAPEKIVVDPARASRKLKEFVRHLGADLVKIGPLNQAWVYSHVGRASYPGKEIGPAIDLPHQHAIVFAFGLKRDFLRCAPQLPIELEVASRYLRLASIGAVVASYIRSLGYSARAHNVRNYQVILPPIAIDAGLGELGRNGVMVTEEYGNAIKMAAVTTDMPLAHDAPVDLKVDEYCRECRICADYCPVNAIPHGDKIVVRGIRKWKINDAACYGYWRKVGTDCGICLAVCPWSRTRSFPHNLILRGVESSSLFRTLAVRADRVLGSRRRNPCPDWLEEQPEVWREGLRPDHPLNR